MVGCWFAGEVGVQVEGVLEEEESGGGYDGLL